MQRILHCCQNLNLFPYLLYSLENSKSHPLAKRINLFFDLLLKKLVQRVVFIHASLQCILLCVVKQHATSVPRKVCVAPTPVQDKRARLCKVQEPKPKEKSILLVIAIYLAPLVLAFQLFGLSSLLFLGELTPGFLFLFSSLIFLGYIAMKIMFHSKLNCRLSRKEKRKVQ